VTRPPIILIHGGWHGAWCWHRVVPLLESAGARVITPDLPAMGADATPATAVTLESWCDTVADTAERHPGSVLVGHSLAGAVISRVAERMPAGIRQLVYLAAYLLPAGGTVAQAARADAQSLLAPNMVPARRGVSCTLREHILRDAFYGECGDEDFEFARRHLSPQPLKPLVTPLQVSESRFGAVPRAYIETTRDRAITLGAQRRMQAELPCSPVFTLDSDHSPFLSQPAGLARILISI
jgi:pimeloyl-ACP methyl ester carboxylesterase